jgi:hypothetical protein
MSPSTPVSLARHSSLSVLQRDDNGNRGLSDEEFSGNRFEQKADGGGRGPFPRPAIAFLRLVLLQAPGTLAGVQMLCVQRKSEVRRTAQTLKGRYPKESPKQLAVGDLMSATATASTA